MHDDFDIERTMGVEIRAAAPWERLDRALSGVPLGVVVPDNGGRVDLDPAYQNSRRLVTFEGRHFRDEYLGVHGSVRWRLEHDHILIGLIHRHSHSTPRDAIMFAFPGFPWFPITRNSRVKGASLGTSERWGAAGAVRAVTSQIRIGIRRVKVGRDAKRRRLRVIGLV